MAEPEAAKPSAAVVPDCPPLSGDALIFLGFLRFACLPKSPLFATVRRAR